MLSASYEFFFFLYDNLVTYYVTFLFLTKIYFLIFYLLNRIYYPGKLIYYLNNDYENMIFFGPFYL